MRVLFWGTPDFAIPSVRALAEEGHELVGVVTQPDRPAGRGRVPRPSPVKREAEAAGVPVLQPERPRGEAFLERLRALAPDISVVAAYGELLPDPVLSLPPAGSLNVHASLLPELRGAAPVNWAIIRGHEESGVTIMRMVRELDAGPILHQIRIPTPSRMTAGELYERCAELGAEALVEALALLAAGRIEEREQDHARATYAPKLGREEARLDWSRPAAELDRWVRGCDPWPAAWSELDGVPVQLFEPRPSKEDASAPPGSVITADPREGLAVSTGRGVLWIGAVKPAGKRRMSAEAWLRGRGIAEGDRLE